MSKDQVACQLNEQELATKTNGLVGLLIGLSVKYGLPSLCCAWLFYVIWCKDLQLYQQSERVTTALVESNHARAEESEARKQTADAINHLAEAIKGFK